MILLRRPSLPSALWALWCVVTVGWLVTLALGAVFSSPGLSCELAPGSSIFGQADWRLARLGTVCSYDLEELDVRIVDVPRLRWVVSALLLLWGLSLHGWRRSARALAAALASR